MANVEERVDERAEESAEETLARLEQYVASVGASRPVPAPVDTLIPSHDVAPVRRRRFVSEIAPALTAVSICSFVILSWAWFTVGVAAGVGGALALLGLVGLVRRVPLARAYIFGLVVAAFLIRLS
jgi:hypothetical protein